MRGKNGERENMRSSGKPPASGSSHSSLEVVVQSEGASTGDSTSGGIVKALN